MSDAGMPRAKRLGRNPETLTGPEGDPCVIQCLGIDQDNEVISSLGIFLMIIENFRIVRDEIFVVVDELGVYLRRVNHLGNRCLWHPRNRDTEDIDVCIKELFHTAIKPGQVRICCLVLLKVHGFEIGPEIGFRHTRPGWKQRHRLFGKGFGGFNRRRETGHFAPHQK